ncbi:MAG TPA: hypothetical protein VH591_12785 [Ktedonobacterales bacterium]|jgi:hypothetical protein
MVDQAHLLALHTLYTRINRLEIHWAITGSLGFALHGIPVTVHDIDVQTDREGAYLIQRCFADCIVRPVAFRTSERIQSHFGVLRVEGIEVEIMGDIQKRLPDGGWDEPPRLADHTECLPVDGMPVPVLSVEYEYAAYLRLGRTEKAHLLRAWLDRAGK